MRYTESEVMQFIAEEDVKFIRLAFCDVFGNQKNISIMPSELKRAFLYGVAIDGSAIAGFGEESHSELYLHPDSDTLCILPWRPEHGRVVRMFCSVTYPDGRIYEKDTRNILKNAVEYAKEKGIAFDFGAEMEFYLFKRDERGMPTNQPYDNAGYMDIAPEDKGENVGMREARKHVGWYMHGLRGAAEFRRRAGELCTFHDLEVLVQDLYALQKEQGAL